MAIVRYIDNGRALTGPLTSGDLRAIVKQSTLTDCKFHADYIADIASKSTFDRWIAGQTNSKAISPPATLLGHLTAKYTEIYALARLVLIRGD